MANESMFGVLGQATELRQRILFTLGALIVYRLGTYIPVPGINAVALSEIVNNANSGVLGMFNMFSGWCFRTDDYICTNNFFRISLLQSLCN